MTYDEFMNLKKGDIVRVTANGKYKNYYGVVSERDLNNKVVCIDFAGEYIPKELAIKKVRIMYSFCVKETNNIFFSQEAAEMRYRYQEFIKKYPGLSLDSFVAIIKSFSAF